MATIDLDLNSFSKEELINLIVYMHINGHTFNQSVESIIKNYIETCQQS